MYYQYSLHTYPEVYWSCLSSQSKASFAHTCKLRDVIIVYLASRKKNFWILCIAASDAEQIVTNEDIGDSLWCQSASQALLRVFERWYSPTRKKLRQRALEQSISRWGFRCQIWFDESWMSLHITFYFFTQSYVHCAFSLLHVGENLTACGEKDAVSLCNRTQHNKQCIVYVRVHVGNEVTLLRKGRLLGANGIDSSKEFGTMLRLKPYSRHLIRCHYQETEN